MENVRIVTVSNAKEMDTFLSLPYAIYADAPLWVPPITKQERALLPKGKHSYWEHAKGQCFLAMRANRPVGRIAAVLDTQYNTFTKQRCGAWGFFECYNDKEAAHALFDTVLQWHAAQGMEYIRGPLNPSTNYTCGMLVHGFELAPSIMMPWNHAYYPTLAESWHMRKEQDLFAYTFEKSTLKIPQWLHEQVILTKNHKEFTWRTSTKATLEKDMHTLFNIYKESWKDNWGFTPISLQEAEQQMHEMKEVIDPDFFIFVYCNDEPVGTMVALPNMNPLLKKLNGKIGLSAPWHLWRTKSAVRNNYRLVLFGVREEYRNRGVPMLLFDAILEQARHKPVSSIEGAWSLEDNVAINDLIENFGGVLTKRYRIYRKNIASSCYDYPSLKSV